MATLGIGSNPLNPLARTKSTPKEEILAETQNVTPPPSSHQVLTSHAKSVDAISVQSSSMSDKLPLDKLLEALAEHEYVAKARPKFVKHTFDMKEGTYLRFNKMCPSLGRKVKEAVTEAINDWCDKYQKQYETIKEAKGDS